MLVKINCTYNDNGAWCKNKKVKRSMWGLGARCCILYPPDQGPNCIYQDKKPKGILVR